MKKFYKENPILVHIVVLVFITLLLLAFFVGFGYSFGACYDWYEQSVAFYEYFRNLFYKTGEIFPDLALHIGGGQNIYYFVYYGLFSPFLLISYLFPFIRSGDFIIIVSIFTALLSTILFYLFLIKNDYSTKMSMIGALLFLFSAPLFARSFIHIMMIQYMPFLILGLFGTKKYLDEHKSLLLIISVVLIITTSYYFSIPSIICLCLYALYYYLKINDKVNFKGIFKCGIKYVLKIMLGIIITSFLLLPVLFTILNGRTTINYTVTILDFVPKIKLDFILYSSYGLGLIAIILIALVFNFLYLKKENKILSIILTCIILFPIFNLMLNGMLYIHGKVFIPLIPLFLILVIEMLNNIKISKFDFRKILIPDLLCILLCIILMDPENFRKTFLLYGDLICTGILLLLFYKKKKLFYIIPIVLLSLCMSIINIKNSSLLLRKEYDERYERILFDTNSYVNSNTNSIYRYQDDIISLFINYSDASSQYKASVYSSTSNGLYNNLFYTTFNNNYHHPNLFYLDQNKNLFFQKFMGIRYLSIKGNPPYGYKLIEEYEGGTLYENRNVFSIGFASSNLLNYDEYNKLSFIEKLQAYIHNIIINGESHNSDLEFNYEKVDLNYNVKNVKNVEFELKDNHYIIKSGYNGRVTLALKEKIKNKTLVIRFKLNTDLSCNSILSPTAGIKIRINNIPDMTTCQPDPYHNYNNTFDYVISSNEDIEELNIEFYKSIYDISDIEVYAIDNEFFDKNNTIPLEIDFDKTKGDDIYGSIDVLEDGYFIFTIPYDKGYTVYVDNKEVEIEKVSEGFIGFKINKGNHDIHLTFKAPYAKLGRIISLIGIIILIILNIYESKKDNNVIIGGDV